MTLNVGYHYRSRRGICERFSSRTERPGVVGRRHDDFLGPKFEPPVSHAPMSNTVCELVSAVGIGTVGGVCGTASESVDPQRSGCASLRAVARDLHAANDSTPHTGLPFMSTSVLTRPSTVLTATPPPHVPHTQPTQPTSTDTQE